MTRLHRALAKDLLADCGVVKVRGGVLRHRAAVGSLGSRPGKLPPGPMQAWPTVSDRSSPLVLMTCGPYVSQPGNSWPTGLGLICVWPVD
jgi:hypothetical protein